MGAPALPMESEALLALTAFVTWQSRGMPMNVDISGEARSLLRGGQGVLHEAARAARSRLPPVPRPPRRFPSAGRPDQPGSRQRVPLLSPDVALDGVAAPHVPLVQLGGPRRDPRARVTGVPEPRALRRVAGTGAPDRGAGGAPVRKATACSGIRAEPARSGAGPEESPPFCCGRRSARGPAGLPVTKGRRTRLAVAALAALVVLAAFGWANRHPELAPVEPPDDRGTSTPPSSARERRSPGSAPAPCAIPRSAASRSRAGASCRRPSASSTRRTSPRMWRPGSARGRRPPSGAPCTKASTGEGRHLYPAFPYDHFTRVTDEDVDAIYAYLMTREPVVFEAPDHELAFPFNVRMLLAGWKLLFLETGRFEPDESRDDEWNRGAYLAEGLGHCGACHTPRNAFGALEEERRLRRRRRRGLARARPQCPLPGPDPLEPGTTCGLPVRRLGGSARDRGRPDGAGRQPPLRPVRGRRLRHRGLLRVEAAPGPLRGGEQKRRSAGARRSTGSRTPATRPRRSRTTRRSCAAWRFTATSARTATNKTAATRPYLSPSLPP